MTLGNHLPVWLAVPLLLLAPLLAGCGKSGTAADSTAQEPARISVSVDRVEARTVQREVEAVGTLLAGEECCLSAKVEGRVSDVDVDIGDTVEPGRLLVRLELEDFVWAERYALHGLTETLATLGLGDPCRPTEPAALDIPRDYDVTAQPSVKRARALTEQARAEITQHSAALGAARARIVSADADYRNAEDKLAYTVRLRDSGAATEQELNDARTRADSLKAICDAATADLTAAEARLATSRVAVAAAEAQAEAAVIELRSRVAAAHRMRTALEIVRKNQRDAVAVAPPLPPDLVAVGAQKWSVPERLVSVGEFRKVGDKLVRLAVCDVLRLRLRVPENYLNSICPGLMAEIVTDATGDWKLTGAITRIRPEVNPNDRHFDVEVRIPNTEGRLKPGVFARARIVLRHDIGVLTVPLRSVVSFAGVEKVFVVEGAVARDRPVKLGTRLGDRVEVISGIKAGETVIITGLRLLADRSPVQVTGAAAH